MLAVKSKIQRIVKENKKRMSKDAWVALDCRINAIITGAIKNCGSAVTIRDTEILMSGRAK